jgi:hypothetical protein
MLPESNPRAPFWSGPPTSTPPNPETEDALDPRPGLFRKVPPRRRGPTGRTSPGTAAAWFPERLFTRPTSILVCGPSRPLVNLALYALAQATTPVFQWVDIQVPGEERLPWDPVRLGWVPEDRRWSVDHPSALRPDDLAAHLALFALIRSDEPSPALVQLTDFLRLPEMSQRILAVRPPRGRPGVVAVPNAHRVMATFSAAQVPSILGVHRSAGYSVYIGYAEAMGSGHDVFDLVLELDGTSVADWKDSHLVCAKGISEGRLAARGSVALEEIPLIADVLARATASR